MAGLEKEVEKQKDSNRTVEVKDTLDIKEESQRQAMNATIPLMVEKRKKTGTQSAVAEKMTTDATMEVHTADTAEQASEIKDTKQKSDYKRKKKEKQKEESREKTQSVEKEKKRKETDKKIKAMNKALHKQGSVRPDKAGKLSRFRKALDRKSEKIWNKFSEKQRTALTGYTAPQIVANGQPFFTTMNNILRKGLYKEGGGEETTLQKNDEASKIEQSKQNYEAVTDCINALKTSKLDEDMVLRRGTDVTTLMIMLGLKPEEVPKDAPKAILNKINKENERKLSAYFSKNEDKYDEGNEIVIDRGFLSTTPFGDAGFDGNESGRVDWMIQGHAGDQAFFVANKSKAPHEGEMIFQAGTIFRVLKICPPEQEKGQEGWKVYMETVQTDI